MPKLLSPFKRSLVRSAFGLTFKGDTDACASWKEDEQAGEGVGQNTQRERNSEMRFVPARGIEREKKKWRGGRDLNPRPPT